MSLYGLIGYPLSHSFSPAFFTEYFQKLGIQDEYRPFELASLDELPGLIENQPDLRGFNVTIPFKESILNYLDELTATASEIGAVNTVFILRGKDKYKLIGHNTDKDGFLDTLAMHKTEHKKALVLGCGGASRAVIIGLSELGISFTRACRHPKNANDISIQNIDTGIIQTHSLIINTTPLGMYPLVKDYPVIPYADIGNGHLLYDLIYNPETTVFLSKGRAQGARCMNGLDMLQKQALLSYEWWNRMQLVN